MVGSIGTCWILLELDMGYSIIFNLFYYSESMGALGCNHSCKTTIILVQLEIQWTILVSIRGIEI